MGMYGSTRVMYGWKLTEEELERFDEDGGDDDLWDWTTERGLDYDFGGHIDWDEKDCVVGVELKPWFSDFGVYEIDDDFGEVDISEYEKLKPYIEYFGREPKKYLVTSYG